MRSNLLLLAESSLVPFLPWLVLGLKTGLAFVFSLRVAFKLGQHPEKYLLKLVWSMSVKCFSISIADII